jgi:hypothetical protein
LPGLAGMITRAAVTNVSDRFAVRT